MVDKRNTPGYNRTRGGDTMRTALEHAVSMELERRGMSEAALAKAVGITRQCMHRKLRKRFPTTETLVQVARALGLVPAEFRKLVVAEYKAAMKNGRIELAGPPMIKESRVEPA